MSKLQWDVVGQRRYETGVDHGVLYPKSGSGYAKGVAWNGLTNVNERPSGGELSAVWADNIKYLNLRATENFGATIQAYTYPDEWEECDGSKTLANGLVANQQARKGFGFSYRTRIGNDVDGDSAGYKIHLIYNAEAAPSERGYNTVNDNPEAIQFSWEVDTTPIDTGIEGFRPTAHLIIDSTKFTTTEQKAILKQIEDLIYGTDAVEADVEHNIAAADATDPTLPTPKQLYNLITGEND